jgi:hypothetical protein
LYATARDLAEAALRLLEERRGEDRVGLDIEMAAALLAVHVCDWHYIKTLGHSRATDADKRAFAAIYPDWNILREIANGTKHPEPENIDVSSAIPREAEWVDVGFWNAPQGTKTLFIEVDGQGQSVHSLTFGFCRQYLTDTASPP